jgi:hypothetical protein
MSYFIRCHRCGVKVCTEPLPHGTFILAWVECPECIAKTPDPKEVLRFEVVDRAGVVDARPFIATKCQIKLDYQDHGRTLKVVVTPERQ